MSNFATQIGFGHAAYGTAEAGRYQFKVVCDGVGSNATNLNNGMMVSNHFGTQYYAYAEQPNYLCALSNTNGKASHYCACKVYGCTMYKNYGDEMVRCFVPAKHIGDGEIGMYDLVNGVFYKNAGGDAFIAGPAIDNSEAKVDYPNPEYKAPTIDKTLPDAYQAVEYIEGTGDQYINLDVQAYEDTSTEICIVPDTDYTSENGIWGTLWSQSAQFLELYEGVYRWHNGGTAVDADEPLGKETVIKTDAMGVTIDGEYYSCYTNGSYSNNPIRLYGAYGTSGYCAHFKTKYFKIYESGKIVRDLIPCYLKSTGEAGLYDLYNDKFYGNKGTGEFGVGPNVAVSTTLRTYEKVEAVAEDAQIPTPDIFSFKINEDGSATDAVSGTVLESVGNPTAEQSEYGLCAVFDGQTYYKYNDFAKFYPTMRKSVTFEFVGEVAERTPGQWESMLCNFEGGGLGIEKTPQGTLDFEIYIRGSYVHVETDFERNKTLHMVATFDGTKATLYLNGEKVASKRVNGSVSYPAAETAHYLGIGADSNAAGTGDYPYTGTMLVGNIYSQALNATQVKALYDSYNLK